MGLRVSFLRKSSTFHLGSHLESGDPPPRSHRLPTGRLKDLQVIQKKICSQLTTAYTPGTPETSHQFQVGDCSYIQRHGAQTLKPR
ncbi:rCG41404 [Rattus norvegicus]|uniref:RCG41404 n=1 Tax=Rattus norvegicus TaxID=10116 RepID=A6IH23_RAT|nr:rCG41404 [Rattus norvegicus]